MAGLGRYLFHSVIGAIAGGMFAPYMVIYAATIVPHFGQIGILLAAYAVAKAVLSYPMGILSDKIGRKAPIFIGGLGMAYIVYRLISASTVTDLYLLIPITAIFSTLGGSASQALDHELTESGEKQGTKLSSLRLVDQLAGMAAILAAGVIIQGRGFPFLFKIIIILQLAYAFTVFIVDTKGGKSG